MNTRFLTDSTTNTRLVNELTILTSHDFQDNSSPIIKRTLPIYWSDNDEPVIYYFNSYPIRIDELNIFKLYQIEFDIIKGENRKQILNSIKEYNNIKFIDRLSNTDIRSIPDCSLFEESFKKAVEHLWFDYQGLIIPILERIKYPDMGKLVNIRLAKEIIPVEKIEQAIKNLEDSPSKQYFEKKIEEYYERKMKLYREKNLDKENKLVNSKKRKVDST